MGRSRSSAWRDVVVGAGAGRLHARCDQRARGVPRRSAPAAPPGAAGVMREHVGDGESAGSMCCAWRQPVHDGPGVWSSGDERVARPGYDGVVPRRGWQRLVFEARPWWSLVVASSEARPWWSSVGASFDAAVRRGASAAAGGCQRRRCDEPVAYVVGSCHQVYPVPVAPHNPRRNGAPPTPGDGQGWGEAGSRTVTPGGRRPTGRR